MDRIAIAIALGLIGGAAQALTPQNLTCDMPGVGQAAFITGFDGRYQLFDWWDQPSDAPGDRAVVYADCQGGALLRATTVQSDDTLARATDILWAAGKSGQGGGMDALTVALQGAGFTVERQSLPGGHCACTDDMIGLSGQ